MINLPEVIQEMLSYKESLGFSRKTYENYLSDFNKYFSHSAIISLRQRLFCPGVKEETQKLLKVSAAESPHSGNYQNICMQWGIQTILYLQAFFQLLAGPCHIFLQMMNCVECLPRAIRNRTVKQTHAAI